MTQEVSQRLRDQNTEVDADLGKGTEQPSLRGGRDLADVEGDDDSAGPGTDTGEKTACREHGDGVGESLDKGTDNVERSRQLHGQPATSGGGERPRDQGAEETADGEDGRDGRKLGTGHGDAVDIAGGGVLNVGEKVGDGRGDGGFAAGNDIFGGVQLCLNWC